MSNEIKILYNANCSKSRKTLKLLLDRNITPVIVDYLNEPIVLELIEEILFKLNKGPRDIMRKKELQYTKNNIDNKNLGSSELIELMLKYPILIERPIVLANNKAIICRPPERVIEIL